MSSYRKQKPTTGQSKGFSETESVHLPAHSLGSWLCLPSYEAASLLGLMSIIQPGLSVALKLGTVSSAIMVGSGEVALQNSEMKGQLQSLITLETITD